MSGPVQFTKAGFIPAGSPIPQAPVNELPEDEFEEAMRIARPPRLSVEPPIVAQPPRPAPPKGPINVLALAKKRLKEVRAELRRMKSLEKERLELERLIAAATKPVAAVASIKPARTA